MGRPSVELDDYLEGRNPNASDAVKSWARFFIYKKSLQILRLPKEKRLSVINQAPDYLIDRLKNEITRVWRLKNATTRN